MNYMDFDPYLIRERNQQMLKEVLATRCEERLQENGGGRASRGATPGPESYAAAVPRGRTREVAHRQEDAGGDGAEQ